MAATIRSPYPAPGARRASLDRRGRIDAMAISPRSPRSSSTSSPTASLGPPCLSRPRSAHSYVSPSTASTRQTPPVPESTVPCISRPTTGGSFVPHRIPPAARRAIRRLLANEPLQHRLHVVQGHRADRRPRFLLGHAVREIVGLEMPFDSLRADSPPAQEHEECTERAIALTGVVHHDLDAIRHAVRSLERRGPRVHRR